MPLREMESTQPLEALMIRLGLSNADLVKASTEQLTFKMVQKGRTGRRLTRNVQEKILRALLTVRPDLKVRRRELFRAEPDESAVAQIEKAFELIGAKKIKYPQFVDRLAKAQMTHYAVNVAANRVTFYAVEGEAYVKEGPAVSTGAPGLFNKAAILSAIKAAQEAKIDHPTFLKRIHDAGIGAYEVNIRNREIRYKGETESYKEMIPVTGARPEKQTLKPATPPAQDSEKPAKPGKTKKAVKTMKRGKKWKRVKLHRVKKGRYRRSR